MLWFHLVAAVMAVGGVYFLRLILMPIVKKDGCEHAPALSAKVTRKFRKMIWHSIALLAVSGGVLLCLTWLDIAKGPSMKRHLLELKILLALVMFTISFLITIPSPSLERFRQRAPTLLLVNLGLAFIILLLVAVRQAIF